MTTVDYRSPAVLEGVPFVETTRPVTLPPQPAPTYVRNSRFNMYAAFAGVVLAGLATVWAVAHDNRYAPLLMAATFALVAAVAGFTRAFNRREQALEVVR